MSSFSLTNPIDPSLPGNSSPLFADVSAARADQLRANNSLIWANFTEIASYFNTIDPNGSVIGQNLRVTDSPTFAGLTLTGLTGGFALYSSAGQILMESLTTNLELGYVHGVTSSIQTQLNSKQANLTIGNLTETISSVLTITGGTSAIIGSGLTINVKQATGSQNGYLSSSDWSTFNNKQNALTNPVTGTGTSGQFAQFSGSTIITGITTKTAFNVNFETNSAHIEMNGVADVGSTGNASDAGHVHPSDTSRQASLTGIISGTANQITVSSNSNSVAQNITLSLPQNIAPASSPTFAELTLTGLTGGFALYSSSGQIISESTTTILELGYVHGVTSSIQTQLDSKQAALTAGYGDTTNPYASKTANYFLSAPDGSSGSPSFRAIVADDIPTLNQNTSGSAGSLISPSTTGLIKFTGMSAGTTRVKTVSDINDTLLELGGSYTPTGTWTSLTLVTPVLGTPTSGNLANCTFPTLNQNTTGYAGGLYGGVLGSMPYQSAPNTTGFISPNTSTTQYILAQTGTGSAGALPTWINPSTLNIGNASTISINFNSTNAPYPIPFVLSFGSSEALYCNNNLFYNPNSNTLTAGTLTLIPAVTKDGIILKGYGIGSSSYAITVTTPSTALAGNFTLTLPAITDTLVTLTATQILTNKTFGGSVGIGTTSPTYSLDVIGTGRFTGGAGYGVYASTTGTGSYGVYGYSSLYVSVGGNTAYNSTSTYYQKYGEDISIIDAIKINPFKVKKYIWEDSNHKSFWEFIGPYKEDIYQTFRLTESMDGLFSVDGIALGLGIELLDEVTVLQNKIIDTEAQIATMQAQINQLLGVK